MPMPIEAPHSEVRNTPSSERDRKLQLVRRLDWRFLLPEPRLGRALYLGPGNDSLVEALAEFSEHLTVLPAAHPSPSVRADGWFDLAVVQAPRTAVLERAMSLLKDGGFLYCESHRTRWRDAFRAADRQDDCSGDPGARLWKLGFCDVESYCHYPNFEQCRQIISLTEPSVVELLLARSGKVPFLTRKIARHAVSRGLLPRFLRCVSLVARKGPEPEFGR